MYRPTLFRRMEEAFGKNILSQRDFIPDVPWWTGEDMQIMPAELYIFKYNQSYRYFHCWKNCRGKCLSCFNHPQLLELCFLLKIHFAFNTGSWLLCDTWSSPCVGMCEHGSLHACTRKWVGLSEQKMISWCTINNTLTFYQLNACLLK